jgi:hypothetical protein
MGLLAGNSPFVVTSSFQVDRAQRKVLFLAQNRLNREIGRDHEAPIGGLGYMPHSRKFKTSLRCSAFFA